MKEVTMPSKWMGCIHKGQVGIRCSPSEKAHRYDPDDKLRNAGRPEYNICLPAEFLTEPTKDDWPSSVQRVRLPSASMGARQFVTILVNGYPDEPTPDLLSTPSGLPEALTNNLTMGAKGVIESFQGRRVFTLR